MNPWTIIEQTDPFGTAFFIVKYRDKWVTVIPKEMYQDLPFVEGLGWIEVLLNYADKIPRAEENKLND